MQRLTAIVQLKQRLPDKPYHLLFKEQRCPYCDELQEDYDSFLLHLSRRRACLAYILRIFRYRLRREKKGRGNGVARPVERKLIDDDIKKQKKMWPLRENINATHWIKAEIKHIVEDNDIIVAELIGVPCSGKSWTGIAIAFIIALVWTARLVRDGELDPFDSLDAFLEHARNKVHIGFTHAETARYTKIAKRGDVIVQDEDPDALGGGAVASKKDIENILKQLRQRGVSYVFISPLPVDYLHVVNFRLDTYEKGYKDGVNTSIFLNRINDTYGWAKIATLPLDDPLMLKYEEMKQAHVDFVAEEGGSYSVGWDPEQYQEDVERLMQWMKENVNKLRLQNLTKQDAQFFAEGVIHGRGDYQVNVGNEVYHVFKEEQRQEGGSLDSSGEFKRYLEANDLRVLDLIHEYSQPQSTAEELGKLWFYHRIINGETLEDAADLINEELGRDSTRQYYSQCFSEWQEAEHCLGTPAERAIHELYFPNCEHVGGQSQPDLVGDGYIVEVKARYKHDRSVSAVIKNEEYLDEYFKQEHPVKVIIIDYDKNKGRVLGYDRIYQ